MPALKIAVLPNQHAYGRADANAVPKPDHLLPHLNPDWFTFLVEA